MHDLYSEYYTFYSNNKMIIYNWQVMENLKRY